MVTGQPNVNNNTAKFIALGELVLVAVLPMFLIEVGVFANTARLTVYGVFYSLAIPLVLIHHLSLRDLNIRLDNFRDAAGYFAPIVVLLIVVSLVLLVSGFRIQTGVGRAISPWQYLLISVPVQQFVYFGFLPARLRVVTQNKTLSALTIAVFFSASHLPWNSAVFTISTLCVGLLLAFPFMRKPSLPWTFIAHFVLGFFSLALVQLTPP